jgi:methylenetetrahydrofolate reductase (NADPH)
VVRLRRRDARTGRDRVAHPRHHAGDEVEVGEAHGRALGAAFPEWLEERLRAHEDDEDAQFRVGVEAATDLCRDLLEGGVDGLHFYTLNRSPATREIYGMLGLAG